MVDIPLLTISTMVYYFLLRLLHDPGPDFLMWHAADVARVPRSVWRCRWTRKTAVATPARMRLALRLRRDSPLPMIQLAVMGQVNEWVLVFDRLQFHWNGNRLYIYNEIYIYIYIYVYILYIYGHTDSYHPLNPNMGWIAWQSKHEQSNQSTGNLSAGSCHDIDTLW